MNEYYVDFSGWVLITGKNEEEAQNNFIKLIKKFNRINNFKLIIENIDKIENF